jgi:hypothetical protein
MSDYSIGYNPQQGGALACQSFAVFVGVSVAKWARSHPRKHSHFHHFITSMKPGY